jgi:hypothetical protein
VPGAAWAARRRWPSRAKAPASPEALDRADPWHPEAAPAGGEHRRRRVELSADELTEIETAASQIQVQGGRYSEAGERMTNL